MTPSAPVWYKRPMSRSPLAQRHAVVRRCEFAATQLKKQYQIMRSPGRVSHIYIYIGTVGLNWIELGLIDGHDS